MSTEPNATGPINTGPINTGPIDTGPTSNGPLHAEPRYAEPRYAEPQVSTGSPDSAYGREPYAGGASPTARPAFPVESAPRLSPRPTTIVWGLILAIIGVAGIAVALGLRIDIQLVAVALFAVAGLGLLVSALVRSRREG